MNFLQLLRAGHEDYVVCEVALAYMSERDIREYVKNRTQ